MGSPWGRTGHPLPARRAFLDARRTVGPVRDGPAPRIMAELRVAAAAGEFEAMRRACGALAAGPTPARPGDAPRPRGFGRARELGAAAAVPLSPRARTGTIGAARLPA